MKKYIYDKSNRLWYELQRNDSMHFLFSRLVKKYAGKQSVMEKFIDEVIFV